jgi:hypothetical protein
MAVERLKTVREHRGAVGRAEVHRRLLYKWRDQLALVDIGDEPLPENPRESTLRKEVSQLKRLLPRSCGAGLFQRCLAKSITQCPLLAIESSRSFLGAAPLPTVCVIFDF